MVVSVAYLGPPGTYAEAAAIAYTNKLAEKIGQKALLAPYPSIPQTLRALAQGLAHLAVVPVENSVEGSVSSTLDTLWHLATLQIQHALVLPISHALISCAKSFCTNLYAHSHAYYHRLLIVLFIIRRQFAIA